MVFETTLLADSSRRVVRSVVAPRALPSELPQESYSDDAEPRLLLLGICCSAREDEFATPFESRLISVDLSSPRALRSRPFSLALYRFSPSLSRNRRNHKKRIRDSINRIVRRIYD